MAAKEIVARDYTERFKGNRNIIKKKRDKDVERQMNLYKMLSFSVNSMIQSSGGSWRRGANINITPVSAPEDLDTTKCHTCKASLSSFFKMMKTSYQCPLCGYNVCNPKCSSQKIGIELNRGKGSASASPSGGTNNETVDINVCDNCYELVTKGKSRQSFKQLLESSSKYVLHRIAEAVHDYSQRIKENLSKLQELSNSIGSIHTKKNDSDIQFGKILVNDLNGLFMKYEQVLKQLSSINPTDSKRLNTILSNMKNAYVQFLQDTLPAFRMISKQIEYVSSLPITEPPKELEKSPSTSQLKSPKSNESSMPIIKSIYPSVVPLSGGKITISGLHFTSKQKLFIDQQKVKFDFINTEEIIVHVPSSSTEQSKSIKIECGDGSYILEQDVLFFSSSLPDPSASDVITSSPSSSFKNLISISEYLPGIGSRGGANTSSSSNEDMFISMINPAASPVDGGVPMKLNGFGFDVKCKLFIDEKLVNFDINEGQEKGEVCLSFLSPSFNRDGFKSVKILNKNGRSAVMNDAIYYFPSASPAASSPNTAAASPTSTPKREGRVWGKR